MKKLFLKVNITAFLNIININAYFIIEIYLKLYIKN